MADISNVVQTASFSKNASARTNTRPSSTMRKKTSSKSRRHEESSTPSTPVMRFNSDGVTYHNNTERLQKRRKHYLKDSVIFQSVLFVVVLR